MLTTRAQGISPAALAALPTNCPAALRRVLLKALSADRDQRWASGAELNTRAVVRQAHTNMCRKRWRDWISKDPDIGYRELCPGLPPAA